MRASAPGKVILLGEHAVVYGRPAIAVPVSQVRASASIVPAPPGAGLTIVALDLERSLHLGEAALDDPLAVVAFQTLAHLGLQDLDGVLTVTSAIPIGGGMGSGAAVSAAVVRALAGFVGADLPLQEVSDLVYEVEKLHHGTPSGIDNTVVVYERPVYFVRGQPLATFGVGRPLPLLIADSGIPSSTRAVVGAVRRRWEADPLRYDALFDRIGERAVAARDAIEGGDAGNLGRLMDQNHQLLQEIGVSMPALDRLVEAALAAGALGAKLSGAGGGGSVIALVEAGTGAAVEAALRAAGAVQVLHTVVA
ncbi:MAG: mevalonate kinase [Anaerolineae bacterium]|nr:mevalonate kinase [Anaerolineae bacterium]